MVMVKEIIITLVAGFIIFEVIEHIVFPLVWSFIQRRKGSICDVSSMVGKVGDIKQWQDLEGIKVNPHAMCHPSPNTSKAMTNITALNTMNTKNMGTGTDNERRNHSSKNYLIKD